MPYEVITKDQFRKLRDSGYSVEKIAEFEKKRKMESGGTAVLEQPQEEKDLKQPFEGFIKNERMRQGVEDLSAPAAHFTNQFLFNQPRALAEKFGYDFPEAEDLSMNVISKAAGVTGGIVGGGKLLKAFGLGKKVTQAATLGQKIIQGGKAVAAGATGGALYAPEDITDFEARKEQAMLGGAIVPLGAGVAKFAPKILGKVGQTFKVLRGPNQNQIKANISKISSEVDIVRSGFNKSRLDITAKQAVEQKMLNDQIKQARIVFKENNDILLNKLDKAVETGTLNTRNTLREVSSAASQTYGEVLDNINERLVKSNSQMTKEKFVQILENTLQRGKDGALPQNRISNKISTLYNKLNKTPGQKFLNIVDQDGNLIPEVYDKLDDVIDFKGLVSEIKTLRKGLSDNFKNGIGATPDDIIFDMFQDEYGKWVSENVKDFAVLQSEYAPIAQLKKQANRIFKPWDTGEYKTKEGANLLRRFGLSRKDDLQGEKRLLKAIEEGFELQGQKIGGKEGIYTDIDGLGNQIKELAENKETLINSIRDKLDNMKFTNKQQRISLENQMSRRIEELTAKKMTESMNLKNRADADRLTKILVGAGLGIAGARTFGLTRLTEH